MDTRNSDFCEETTSRDYSLPYEEGLLGYVNQGPSLEEMTDRLLHPTRYEDNNPVFQRDAFRVTMHGHHTPCKPMFSCFSVALKQLKVLKLQRKEGHKESFIFSGVCEVHATSPHLGEDVKLGWSARFKAYYNTHGPAGEIYLKAR